MKARVRISALAALIVVSAVVGAYLRGQKDALRREFKECNNNLLTLLQWETNHPPELKEYVKARYYYLANRVPKDLVSQPVDYGPVSTNVATLAVFKGPSSGQSEYADYLQRFNLSKPPP